MTPIQKLLAEMQGKYAKNDTEKSINRLENNAETWRRIGEKDSFDELNFDSEEEKEKFLEEWVSENEYKNI